MKPKRAEPIEESKPHLSDKTAALQTEHCQFRAILREMGDQVGGISPDNEPHFDAFCRDSARLSRPPRPARGPELAILQELHNAEGEGARDRGSPGQAIKLSAPALLANGAAGILGVW